MVQFRGIRENIIAQPENPRGIPGIIIVKQCPYCLEKEWTA